MIQRKRPVIRKPTIRPAREQNPLRAIKSGPNSINAQVLDRIITKARGRTDINYSHETKLLLISVMAKILAAEKQKKKANLTREEIEKLVLLG